MANETAKHISNPPWNETLSHSNGKVVFDHGPKHIYNHFNGIRKHPVLKDSNMKLGGKGEP